MIHHVYVGHFKRDGQFIAFENQGDAVPARYSPVVLRPLDSDVIDRLLADVGLSQSDLPHDSGLRSDDKGYIAFDRFSIDGDAVDFIRRLARTTGCDIADYSSLSFIAADDLVVNSNASREAV